MVESNEKSSGNPDKGRSGQQYGFMLAEIVAADVQRRSERAEETYGGGARDTHEPGGGQAEG